MSPLLFNLAISDLLANHPKSWNPNLFMDDLAVSSDIHDIHKVIVKVRREITSWECD